MNQTKEDNRMYLVTGAAGFLGGTICRQLIKQGKRVRAFVLPNDKAMKFVPKECEIAEGDLTDLDSLEKFFTVPAGTKTVVLHIASIVTVDPGYNPTVMNVNVGGTKNIVKLCKSHPEVEKLVYCSSTGAIPELPKGQVIHEVSDFSHPDPKTVVGCYSQSKALATQVVLDAVRHDGLHACVVHPSGIMGPEDYAIGETTGTLIKIIKGEMPAGIDGSFNLCDVRDLAAATISAVDNGRDGECYILANEPVSFRAFCKMISDEAGCKPVKMFLPLWFANALGGMMERQAKRRGTKPIMTKFSVYNLARNNSYDSSRARRELDYHTRSYKETIHDEVQWLIRSGHISDPKGVQTGRSQQAAHA